MKNEKRDNLFSLKSNCYASARPRYPDELYQYLASLCKERKVAWDCATGSGQSAISLIKYFDHVKATDISVEQIKHAFKHERIDYSIQPSEKTNFPDNEFDLITVAQALHWFKLAQFWSEVHRVIKPEGIFAAWGYSRSTISEEIDVLIKELILDKIESYWLPENRLLQNGYEDIDFPLTLFEPSQEFSIEQTWMLNRFFDYIETWSAMKKYLSKEGHGGLNAAKQEIGKIWEVDAEKKVKMNIFLKVGQFKT